MTHTDNTYNDADGNPRCSCCGSHVRVVGGKTVCRIPDAPATMTHTDDIAATAKRVIALDKAATPGPWEVIYERYHEGIAHIHRDPETREITYCETVQGTDANDSFEDFKYPDEKLVLYYRAAAPMLAAEVLRLHDTARWFAQACNLAGSAPVLAPDGLADECAGIGWAVLTAFTGDFPAEAFATEEQWDVHRHMRALLCLVAPSLMEQEPPQDAE